MRRDPFEVVQAGAMRAAAGCDMADLIRVAQQGNLGRFVVGNKAQRLHRALGRFNRDEARDIGGVGLRDATAPRSPPLPDRRRCGKPAGGRFRFIKPRFIQPRFVKTGHQARLFHRAAPVEGVKQAETARVAMRRAFAPFVKVKARVPHQRPRGKHPDIATQPAAQTVGPPCPAPNIAVAPVGCLAHCGPFGIRAAGLKVAETGLYRIMIRSRSSGWWAKGSLRIASHQTGSAPAGSARWKNPAVWRRVAAL